MELLGDVYKKSNASDCYVFKVKTSVILKPSLAFENENTVDHTVDCQRIFISFENELRNFLVYPQINGIRNRPGLNNAR